MITRREAHDKLILDSIRSLRLQVDSRVLCVALLANAAAIAETLIAAGIMNAQQVTNLWAESCVGALNPIEREEAPHIQHFDGDEPEGKMH